MGIIIPCKIPRRRLMSPHHRHKIFGRDCFLLSLWVLNDWLCPLAPSLKAMEPAILTPFRLSSTSDKSRIRVWTIATDFRSMTKQSDLFMDFSNILRGSSMVLNKFIDKSKNNYFIRGQWP